MVSTTPLPRHPRSRTSMGRCDGRDKGSEMTEQLKALAEAAKGWNTNHAMPEIDGEPIDVGQLLDGEFYPIITVDCGQYDQTSKHLAEYICYATPQRILALIAENERADKLLQQALEYAKLMKLYGPALGYGNTTIDDHIAALRTYLEGKK